MTNINYKESELILKEIEHFGEMLREVSDKELQKLSKEFKKTSDELAQKFKASIANAVSELIANSVSELDVDLLDQLDHYRQISADAQNNPIDGSIHEQSTTIPTLLPKEIYSEINQQDPHMHELNKIVENMFDSYES